MATSVNRRQLELTTEERAELERISISRTLPAVRISRARLMLAFAKGDPVAVIAANLNTSESTVHVTVARALKRGVLPALKDLQRSGRPNVITPEAMEWLVNLACQKPKDPGVSARALDA